MPDPDLDARLAARREKVARAGRVLGPLVAVIVYALLPDTTLESGDQIIAFGHAGRATVGVGSWMAIWWMTEAIPIYATALLPLALFSLLGVQPMRAAASPYGHELIFLFMGGFLIALALERWGLHRRVAIRALRLVGLRPANVVGGFMLVSAGLSMWVSNTATAIMMLPVALSLVVDAEEGDPFPVCLLLGIAYGCSIGGIGTPIGTPPNVFVLAYMKRELGISISFAEWMLFALPLVALMLVVTWALLTRVLLPLRGERVAGAEALLGAAEGLGPMSRGERRAGAVFLMAASAWILQPLLSSIEVAGARPFAGLSDAGIAMAAALLLFVLPAQRDPRVAVLDWETAVRLPWGLLILFGGGLSLAAALRANGVDLLLAQQVEGFGWLAPPLLLVAVVAIVIFLTELTSNTATAAAFIPLLAGVAPGLGLDPRFLAIPAAIAASFAFMLPVATPPNAVVFGSGRLRIDQMIRAGFWLNLVAIGVITALVLLLGLPGGGG